MRPRALLLDALLATLLVAVIAAQAPGPLADWFRMDDFRNLRWVMEYWDEPWRGLVERHAVHGHVRPLVHLSLWAVTPGVGDPYVPQLALLGALRALALAGFGALAWRLGGGVRGALLTMLLGAGMHGFQLLGSWVAWICSAGQLALGTWALVALDVSFTARRSWPALILAGVLALGAGLFKEPGWVVVPFAAAALCRARGVPLLRVAPFFLLGAAGFAYAWHPDNATRYLAGGGALGERVLEGLAVLPASAISGWPAWSGPSSGALPGIPAAFVFAALCASLPLARRNAAILWAVATALGCLGPAVAGPLVVTLAVAVLVVRRDAPPVGLVLYLVETGLAVPLSVRNEVQALGGGLGLALFTVDTLLRQPWTQAQARTALAVGAALFGVPLVAALSTQALTEPNAEGPDARERLTGLAALVETMGPAEAMLLPPERLYDPLLPMTGLFEREQLAMKAAVSIGDDLLLNPPPGAIEKALLGRSRLSADAVTWLGASHEEVSRGDVQWRSLPLEPGWYAVGLAPSERGGSTFGAALHVRDACDNRASATSPAAAVSIALEIVQLQEGCPWLALAWTGDRDLDVSFILAPLMPRPVLAASRGQPLAHQLDVGVSSDEALARPAGAPATLPAAR